MEKYIQQLNERRETAHGGTKDLETQHKKGRLTAQERIDLLFDPGTFNEIDTLVTTRYDSYMGGKNSRLGDGVVTGYGLVNGRQVFVAAQNAAVMGGSLGEMHANKIVKAMHMALKYGCPFIAMNDSGGARIQEGVDSLAGYARIFDANCEASGVIPQFSLIMGPCAGGAVYSPALTDFVFMTENSYMFITGPDVVKAVMQEEVNQETLGGGRVHSEESGVSHFLSRDDRECLTKVRELLSYLPSNNQDDPPYVTPRDDPNRRCPELEELVPTDPHQPYDVRQVIASIVDDGRFLEVHELWAQNMVVGFARLNGWVVGIVANQPMVLAGTIDIKASIKAAHFIRICDAYNVPIITLQDVPGFLPGTNQEYGGIIRNGARMIYAYSEATVPKLMIILRKSYGGAYCVMSSKGLRGDLLYAWPNAEIAVMGAEGAVNILFRNDVKAAEDPAARRRELVDTYETNFNNPYVAAARGMIDDVIEPRDSRRVLVNALQLTLSKRERHIPRKHGISPM
ncbi:MAG: acyl-CoA carboxylase subunit beta [Chloroflexi bacterium AL-W]|nr:acyl-CoA carboxylase subunit beta [Chloroflexi bacterium AL-N1]NOK66214.1 acyl-CoA carboxylase subunit beta [Chloroflexi bacterium AL-N10]NOK73095.1 acyl-CoA carboxylase subunit beta [Chloroflexi bacterium AL-N5]NOK79992.1 acyl-CoA carboxylase subunit beta [Chloroflexi bacterium AL-W]NOK88152.1 acyl-CoA carboxylase subunit beta [Chloroflexi bacterium AL-N15]